MLSDWLGFIIFATFASNLSILREYQINNNKSFLHKYPAYSYIQPSKQMKQIKLSGLGFCMASAAA